MDIKENELLNGSVGFPNSTENNGTLNNPQNNIQPELPTLEPVMNTEVVSFPAEMQTEEMLQPTMPSEFNVFQEQIPQAVEQQPELPTLEPAMNTEVVSFPVEMQTEEMLQPTMPSEFNVFQEQMPQAVEQPEIPVLDQTTNTEMTGSTEQLNEYGKPINHELLKNLAEDTNNLVNPNMLVSPIGKQKEEEIVEVDEPKVDYEEIKEKKNYALMIIIFLIIVAGILLLPTITSIIGY